MERGKLELARIIVLVYNKLESSFPSKGLKYDVRSSYFCLVFLEGLKNRQTIHVIGRSYRKLSDEMKEKFDEIDEDKMEKIGKKMKDSKIYRAKYNKIFDEVYFQGNYVEFSPQETQKNDIKAQNNNEDEIEKEEPNQIKEVKKEKEEKKAPRKKEMTLEEIYDEFWEFIDDNNQEFREFILNDPRRGKII